MKALISGGAGFVGSNFAWHLLENGNEVVVYDNFSRGKGCENNLRWLRSNKNATRLNVIKGDVNSPGDIRTSAKDCELILHAAAQVSVPQSASKPRVDFESNALGTFNVLEVARASNADPVVLYTSSNKVYGIPNSPLKEQELSYTFENLPDGVDESFLLKGEEPYGVSKATGDMYVHAYTEQYGLKAAAFRCSCMFGPHQWGKEEQGWVAWFCIAAALGKPLNIYGNGKQVRDLLYIDDVIEAFDLTFQRIEKVKGESMNLGGGRENVASLLETIRHLESITGRTLPLNFKAWRLGDNKCYYTDNRKAHQLLEWTPKVQWKEGVNRTFSWVQKNLAEVSTVIHV